MLTSPPQRWFDCKLVARYGDNLEILDCELFGKCEGIAVRIPPPGAIECQTPKSTPGLVARTGQTRPGRVTVPGPGKSVA
jgi:hypothetical protein